MSGIEMVVLGIIWIVGGFFVKVWNVRVTSE